MIELHHRSEHDLGLAFGGDTFNTALYLARLTGRHDIAVDYVTALGDDLYSERMCAFFEREGVGTRHVARLQGALPGLYTIRTDRAGERSFTYWRSAAAARETFAGARGERLIRHLETYDLLYASGITLQILDQAQRQTLRRVAAAIRGRGGRVAFDTNFRRHGWPDLDEARDAFDTMLAEVDIAFPTLGDETALFGTADGPAAAARVHGLGVAEVVVKLGPEGCFVSSPAFRGRVPGEPASDLVDTTAAGDSFNAGYLAARLVGQSPSAAARLGNRLAARVVAHPGAIIPAAAMADLVLPAPDQPSPV